MVVAGTYFTRVTKIDGPCTPRLIIIERLTFTTLKYDKVNVTTLSIDTIDYKEKNKFDLDIRFTNSTNFQLIILIKCVRMTNKA